MARILSPGKGMPRFQQPGATIQVVVEGAAFTSGWTLALKTFDMGSSDAGWVLTSLNAVTSGGNTTITGTIPAACTPELLDLHVTHSSTGTMIARQSVAVVETMNPTAALLIFLSDSHGRTDTVDSSAADDEKRGQYRTWKNIEDQNQVWNLLNPRCILNGGDTTFKLNADGLTQATSADVFARYDQATRPLRVPMITVTGNHDLGKVGTVGRSQALLDQWQAVFGGVMYGVVPLATGLDVIAHDYGDPAAKTWAASTLASNTNHCILLQHHSDWNGIVPANNNDYELGLQGHLHRNEVVRSSPRFQMVFPNHKWGCACPIVYSRSGSVWSYSGTTWPANSSVEKKIINDYGTSAKLRASYSQPQGGTANSQVVTIVNELDFGSTDGRVRLVMTRGTYSAAGATILKQYDIGSSQTVVLCKVSIPAASGGTPSTTTVTLTQTSGPPPPTDPPPPTSTGGALKAVLFNGLPSQDANGVSLSPSREAFFVSAGVCGLLIIRTRSDLGGSNPWPAFKTAGYTGPALLYQRPPTEIQLRTTNNGSLLGSQLNDGTNDRTLYNDMINDSATRLYSNSARTAIITSISGDGDTFDPAHPKVRAFVLASVLRQFTQYLAGESQVKGIFFDNCGIWANIKSVGAGVWGNGVQYTASTLDAAEQALLADIRSHLQTNLGGTPGTSWVMAGNLLADSQERSWTAWPLDGIMDEAIVRGYLTQSNTTQYDSAARQQAVIQRAREFLLQGSRTFLMSVHQAVNGSSSDHPYGLGVTLACMAPGNTPAGIPRTMYRMARSDQYGRWFPTNNDYTASGQPQNEPAFPTATLVTRVFEQQLLRIDLSTQVVTYEALPNEPDPTPPSSTEYTASVVGVRASTPTGAQRSGELLPVDGSPRAMLLLRIVLAAPLTSPNSAVLAMPVAVGGAATVHAQLVESFDPATVTWNTRPAARSQSYVVGLTALTANTSAQLDVTAVLRQAVGLSTVHLALLIDADTDVVLYPTATLVLR
jgi:hypothetical protein